MITDVHNLIEALKLKPSKIILVSNLYDWLLKSNWNCILSEELKKYILNGGIVERGVRMNKEDLYPLIGKYLNGYKIVKIEEDPFVKGQINLWTDEWITEYFGDKSIVKFFIRLESNSSKIYKELIDKEIYQLKDNWNKLKEYLHNVDVVIDYSENYDGRFINYDELIDKMQEIEESDSNE